MQQLSGIVVSNFEKKKPQWRKYIFVIIPILIVIMSSVTFAFMHFSLSHKKIDITTKSNNITAGPKVKAIVLNSPSSSKPINKSTAPSQNKHVDSVAISSPPKSTINNVSNNNKSTSTSNNSSSISSNTGSVNAGGSSSQAPTETKAQMVLGAYAGPTNLAGINTVGSLLGHKLKYAMDFLDGTSWSSITQSSWPYPNWAGQGYTMIWGVPILPNSYSPNSNISVVNGSCYGINQGANGSFNNYFKTVAQNMVNAGFSNSIIRLAWEFNGGWFPWSANGCSSQFISYWKNIVTAMRSVSGEHFLFEWNPTLGDQGVGNLANYYPGNNYVDIIGEDVYDINWNNYPGCTAEWQVMLNQNYGLNWFSSFANANNKFMAFPEWGLGFGKQATNCGTLSNTNQQVGGGDDAYFVQQMTNYINNNNFIEATVWYYGTSPLPDSSLFPKATAAFVSGF